MTLALLTPTLLTPLGVILGLLLVFLSSRSAWTNVDRASIAASQERATAVQELRFEWQTKRATAGSGGPNPKMA